MPADIRSKSWQRAVARLADLRAPVYRELFAQFRAHGMNRPRAYERAMAALREADSDLFIRMLAEEYQLWLTIAASDIELPPQTHAHTRGVPPVCRQPDDLHPATRALR